MIKAPQREPVRVSDHALIRYLERAMGLNIKLVREHMTQVCEPAAAIGAVCVRSEGLRFEIVNNTVTTVRPDGISPSQTSRRMTQNKMRREREVRS